MEIRYFKFAAQDDGLGFSKNTQLDFDDCAIMDR